MGNKINSALQFTKFEMTCTSIAEYFNSIEAKLNMRVLRSKELLAYFNTNPYIIKRKNRISKNCSFLSKSQYFHINVYLPSDINNFLWQFEHNNLFETTPRSEPSSFPIIAIIGQE
jgi:hypothetical protein